MLRTSMFADPIEQNRESTQRWSSRRCCGAAMISRFLSPAIVVLMTASAAYAQTPQAPAALFAQLGLTPQQRAAIDNGKPVAKVLSWGGPSEVYVFGAVYIDGSPAAYVKMARNTARLSGTPGYLGV